MYTRQDIDDANGQFWNLVNQIRSKERTDSCHPDLRDLYDDVAYLRDTGITPRIRSRCAAMIDDWYRRYGPAPVDADRGPA